MVRALVFLANVPYSSIRQRPQWLADGFAQHVPTLYVDPVFSWLRSGATASSVTHINDGLAVLHTASGLPLSGYFPPLNAINGAKLAKNISATLTQLQWPHPDWIYASFPKHLDVLRHFPKARICYDVMDDYPTFFDGWQGAVLTRMHRRLKQKCDVLIASSAELVALCGTEGRAHAVLVPNGVSAPFIEACRRATPTTEMSSLPRPIFGYVGAIGPWLDFSVIRELAVAFAGGSVVLVGPQLVKPPRMPKNVHYWGVRPHDQLPPILKALDVALVPFAVSSTTDGVDPVKVYEYLAADLPVLAPQTRALQRFASWLHLCAPGSWVEHARQALATPNERGTATEFLRTSTWDQRVNQVWTLIDHR